MLSLCVAGFGIFACLPVFRTLPTAFLSALRPLPESP
jgi:ACS family tartrate transporter-like MFS transporter